MNVNSESSGDIAQINWMYPCPASNYHKPAEILSTVIGLKFKITNPDSVGVYNTKGI